MSVDTYDGEPFDYYHQRMIRARKDHACSACKGPIRRGDLYSLTSTLYEGDHDKIRRCARCEILYDHLLLKSRDLDEQGVADRLNCGHTYQEVHGCEPPPEIAALAFATPEEAQALIMGMLEKKKSHLLDNRGWS